MYYLMDLDDVLATFHTLTIESSNLYFSFVHQCIFQRHVDLMLYIQVKNSQELVSLTKMPARDKVIVNFSTCHNMCRIHLPACHEPENHV